MFVCSVEGGQPAVKEQKRHTPVEDLCLSISVDLVDLGPHSTCSVPKSWLVQEVAAHTGTRKKILNHYKYSLSDLFKLLPYDLQSQAVDRLATQKKTPTQADIENRPCAPCRELINGKQYHCGTSSSFRGCLLGRNENIEHLPLRRSFLTTIRTRISCSCSEWLWFSLLFLLFSLAAIA